MTRALPLATAALLVAVACSAPEPPEASSTPAPVLPPAAPQAVAVHVQVPASADPAVVVWAQELEAAIKSGQGGLVLVPTAAEAAAVVRIDAVEAGLEEDPDPEGEAHVMRGALVVGESARAFNLVYRGEARPQAEALARNLRRFAAEGGAVVPAPEEAEPEETEAKTGDQG